MILSGETLLLAGCHAMPVVTLFFSATILLTGHHEIHKRGMVVGFICV